MTTLISVDNTKRFVKDQTTYDEWLFAEANDAAVAYLTNQTGREWVKVTAETDATARSYRPVRGSDVLWIHDAASITSIVENGTTLTPGVDYVAEPLNNLSAGGAWRPTDRLIRHNLAWYSDGSKPTVTITAKWGWSTMPAGYLIPFCVCAKAYLMERDVAFGLVALENGEATGAREAKAVRDFIRQYRGHGSWGIA